MHIAAHCAVQPIHMTIVGDSLARGWGARDPRDTLTARIFEFVRRRHPGTTMINLGVPGATTDDIARTQASLVRPRTCSLIVVIAGANDVQKYYTPAHFQRSYTRLLQRLRTRDPQAAIIVMGMPDIALSRRIPWPAKPVIAGLSRAADDSIAGAASQYHAGVVPLYALSLKNAGSAGTLLSSDGIHPNDRGYAAMASATYPVIADLY
jgi:lysophospholipase L1-like esterase